MPDPQKRRTSRLVPSLDELPLTALVPSARWRRARGIRLSHDRQWLEWTRYGEEVRVNESQEGLLTGFLRLADAEPEAILAFAEVWGPLGICRHNKPSTHVPGRLVLELEGEDFQPCEPMRRGLGGAFREPIERWRHYALQAGAIHHAAACLLKGKHVEAERWEPLRDLIPGRWIPTDELPGAASTVDVGSVHVEEVQLRRPEDRERNLFDRERLVLTLAVQRWLDLGDVHLTASWGDGAGAVDLGRDSLFGALGLQLALTTTKHGGFFLCSYCGQPYVPERRPREGEEHFCGDCVEGNVPGRLRTERWRAGRGREGRRSL
jgi:hypothetical protein